MYRYKVFLFHDVTNAARKVFCVVRKRAHNRDGIHDLHPATPSLILSHFSMNFLSEVFSWKFFPISPMYHSYICVLPHRWQCWGFATIYFIFPPPWQVFMLDHVAAGIVRERECMRQDTRDDRRTINFGRVRVQILATCMAGKCSIHCAMSLGLLSEVIAAVIYQHGKDSEIGQQNPYTSGQQILQTTDTSKYCQYYDYVSESTK